MSNIFTSSKGHIVNLDAKRSLPHPEALEELKQHPVLYEMHLERNRKYAKEAAARRYADKEWRVGFLARQMEWRKSESGKAVIRTYQRKWRANNKNHRIAEVIRSRIYRGFALGQYVGRAEEHLGCTIPEYKLWLESKWQPGMSWDNYGNRIGKWCIDHVRPVAFYNLSDPEQLKACFYFLNTAPIWYRENSAKWHIDKVSSSASSP